RGVLRDAGRVGSVAEGHAAVPAAALDCIARSVGGRRFQPDLGNAQANLVLLWSFDGAVRKHSTDAARCPILRAPAAECGSIFRTHHGTWNFRPETRMAAVLLNYFLGQIGKLK